MGIPGVYGFETLPTSGTRTTPSTPVTRSTRTTRVAGDADARAVDRLVATARRAQAQFASWSEHDTDLLLYALARIIAAHAKELAAQTVSETGLGNIADKAAAHRYASLGVYESIRGQPGTGKLHVDDESGITEWASPIGVVFGLVPVTSPVATAIFKTLISLKSRNALILSFHRRAQGVGQRTSMLVRQVLRRMRAPEDLVQFVLDRSSRQSTELLMRHDGVGLVLATGGPGVVRAAHSSGTPALGVGPGNAPAWVCADADLAHAAHSIVLSKSFDHGLVCGSENNLVVDAAVRDAFAAALDAEGAAVLTPEEVERLSLRAIDPAVGTLRRRLTGQSAAHIAAWAEIRRNHEIRLLVVPTRSVGPDDPYSCEKLAPIVSLFTCHDASQGLRLCRGLLNNGGAGHTAVIHTRDAARIELFGATMPASRILVNSPATHGVIGVTSALVPSLTLGCGTFGGNTTTDNVSFRHLYNVKRIARYRSPRVPIQGVEA